MDTLSFAQKIAVYLIPILFAVTVHEAAHGFVANRLGDPTARLQGRVTLNPIPHIDLIGTVILPLLLVTFGGFIFGWAKPVPIDWKKLHHPRRDIALVAAAGPLSNILMAIFWALTMNLAIPLGKINAEYMVWMFYMCSAGIFVNVMLGLLNLIPIPPLDGSRIMSSLLPPRWAYYYSRIEPYGFIILLALLFIGVLNDVLMPIVTRVAELIFMLSPVR